MINTGYSKLNEKTELEIRRHGDGYYAILKREDATLGMTSTFNSHTAAYLAGQSLIERYEQNLRSAREFQPVTKRPTLCP